MIIRWISANNREISDMPPFLMPYQIRRGKTGNMYCTWEFDLILLAGLTELKAQISWTDSVTVSSQGILPCQPSS